MGSHVFSPSRLGFFAVLLQETYMASNSWPIDPVDVTDQVWATYIGTPPAGKMLGADATGQPVWVDLPPAPPPTNSQMAAAMLAAGIEIVSTGNPALNGTYPCDALSSSQEGSLLAALTAGLGFPNGVVVRVDTSGNPHGFPPDDFKNYCQAKLIFQQQLNTIIGTGSGAFPAQPTVIP